MTSTGLENYEITTEPGTLTIYRKALTVTVSGKTIRYGDPIPPFEVMMTGFIEGENAESARDFVAPLATTVATPGSPVGSYPITIVGGESLDYQFEITSGAVLTIEKMPLEIQIDSKTKRRGEADPDWSVTYTPALEAHMEVPTLSLHRTPGESLGVYPITTSAVIGIDHYESQMFEGSLTILPSADSSLKDLTVEGKSIRPLFHPDENRYSVLVDESVGEVYLSTETTDPFAVVSVKGETVTSGSSIAIVLDHGVNAIEMIVTAEDGVSTATYWLTVTRDYPDLPSSEAGLSYLSVTPGSLSPGFATDQKEYLVTVSPATDSVVLDARAISSQAAIEINETTTSAGAVTIAVEEGLNSIEIRVTAEDEKTTSLYELTVHRESDEPVQSQLSALWISEGVLTPAFDSGTRTYTVEVDAKVDSIGLRAEATTSGASVTISGQPTTSSSVIWVDLSEGLHTIPIIVAAEGVEQTRYELLVVRVFSPQLSQEASLKEWVVEGYSLDPAFDSKRRHYALVVPYEQERISFQATPAHQAAKFWISDNLWMPGELWTTDLLIGENHIEIHVEAQDSTSERSYHLTITRQTQDTAEEKEQPEDPSTEPTRRRTSEPRLDEVVKIKASYAFIDGRRQIMGTRETSDDGLNTRLTVEKERFEAELAEAIADPEIDGMRQMVVLAQDIPTARIETRLTAGMIKRLEEHSFHLIIDAGDVVYDLPAKALSIDRIAQNLQRTMDEYESIEIDVRITRSGEEALETIRERSRGQGAELLIPPVSFEIIASTVDKDGQIREETIQVFSGAVKRSIVIPETIDPEDVTTAVVIDEGGELYHVPTRVYERDGQWYAEVNSLTNSDYTLITHFVTLEDLVDHWSRESYEDMVSRMVIEKSDVLLPDEAISWIDFEESLLRALGISHVSQGMDLALTADDSIPSQAWVDQTSTDSDLMSRIDGHLHPMAPLTRIEAMSIFERALVLLGYDPTTGYGLEVFKDLEGLTEEERGIASTVVEAGVFNGTSATTLSPEKLLTRAEAVAALRNMLIKRRFIDHLGQQRILRAVSQME